MCLEKKNRIIAILPKHKKEMHLGPQKNGVQRAYNENTLVRNIMCGVSLPWQWDLKYVAHKNIFTDKYNLRSYLKMLDTAFCDKILLNSGTKFKRIFFATIDLFQRIEHKIEIFYDCRRNFRCFVYSILWV